ncbi:MAG: hypothetical protein ACR2I5_04260 [Candidatus Limnocylindria bacterium]|jgi:hypothetical protein
MNISLRPMLGVVAIILLAACGSTATPSASASGGSPVPLAASPGEGLGALPGVEGFAYRAESAAVPGFVEGANDQLGGDVEIEIIQASIANRGEDGVSVIAFGFPGTNDAEAIDYFDQVLGGMEAGIQSGSERGLGGSAYILASNGRSVVMAPFGRTDHLVFIFLAGPTGATEDLAAGILNVEQ